jgi:hypothetical protein
MQQPTRAVEDANLALEKADLAAFNAALSESVAQGVSESHVLNLCIRARQAGWGEAARTHLENYIERNDGASSAIYFQLGFETRIDGQHSKAANWFFRAVDRPNSSYKTIVNYAHMLYASGQFEEADEVLRRAEPASEDDAGQRDIMREFGKYFQNFPLKTISAQLQELKSGPTWRGWAQVEASILAAIAARRPFSMLRLGDGEGAFLTLGEADEAAYPHLYAANRHNRMAMWFGPTFPWDRNGFFEETRRLNAAIADADVVAIPDLPWINNAYKISSHVGIPSLGNVVRYSHLKEMGDFASASIAKDLHLKGSYRRILSAARRATMVTCLVDLPSVVKNYFGLDAVDLIAIPGEEGSRRALGDNVQFGDHYPGVYNKLRVDLRRPWNGEVVLVAAGILGKLYTQIIRESGGVAIDIGSLADMWLGKKTRPGDDRRFLLI